MKALVIVDMQNDFMPGGALGVDGAKNLVDGINAAATKFDHVIATQDWHPANHSSFKPNNPKLGIWPIHCVQDSFGADFVEGLDQSKFQYVQRKGTDPELDSYSAFYDNVRKQKTELDHYLKEHAIDEVVICGVATDHCVKFTALDAALLGYKVSVLSHLCRGVNLGPDDTENALKEMELAGVNVV